MRTAAPVICWPRRKVSRYWVGQSDSADTLDLADVDSPSALVMKRRGTLVPAGTHDGQYREGKRR